MREKRTVALFLLLILCLCAFSACGNISDAGAIGENRNSSEPDLSSEEPSGLLGEGSDGLSEAETGGLGNPHMLDGKRIIFVGNSHSYYGKSVIEKKPTVLEQEARSNDKGYFYQLCKENGAEVSVTNWTFGNHSFTDLFTECAAGRDCDGVKHLDYLTDRCFDYVFMQYESASDASFLENCRMVMDVFKAANENVKFVFHVARRAHENDCSWLSQLDELEAMGVTIVDWGGLVDGLIRGTLTVPSSSLSYDQNSFIIRKSEKDGYHPNMLTGYITTLSLYCAVTGETAAMQTYSFCGDARINREFNFMNFIHSYYTYGNATTNFVEIFESETDMRGLQELIDAFLIGRSYRDY